MSSVGVVCEVISCFEWKIPDFFSHATAVKDQCIYSPSFSYMNCTLQLRLHPKGLWSTSGWISLFLELEKVDPSVDTLNFSLSVKKSDGTVARKIHTKIKKWNLKKNTAFGWSQFLEERVLHQQKSMLAPSDTITIACRMGDAENASAESVGVFTELNTLSSDFSRFFESKNKCDVIIRVQDQEFQAHKVVLMARSPVFRAMFSHDTKEAQEGVVNEPDCDAESFGLFLQYLYTGKFEDVEFNKAHQLYITSDKYNTQKLKSFCVTYMEQNITAENLCEVAALGDRFEEAQLTSAAQAYFNQNFSDVVETDEWSSLLRINYQLANKFLREMGRVLKSKK